MLKLNQTAVLLSFVGLVGAASLFSPTTSVKENPSVEVSQLRKEIERLSFENALMEQRVKNFRTEFDLFQEDFSTLGSELENAGNRRRPRASDISNLQVTMSDLNFSILGLESNMQFLEDRVKKTDTAALVQKSEALDLKISGKSTPSATH